MTKRSASEVDAISDASLMLWVAQVSDIRFDQGDGAVEGLIAVITEELLLGLGLVQGQQVEEALPPLLAQLNQSNECCHIRSAQSLKHRKHYQHLLDALQQQHTI
jgi:hypothetical protein